MVSSVIRASFNGGVERAASDSVTVYERGRVCAESGCSTMLSVYNPSPYCAAHAALAAPRPRIHQSHGPLSERCCANEACNEVFVSGNPKRLYCCQRCRMVAFQRRRARATAREMARQGARDA